MKEALLLLLGSVRGYVLAVERGTVVTGEKFCITLLYVAPEGGGGQCRDHIGVEILASY